MRTDEELKLLKSDLINVGKKHNLRITANMQDATDDPDKAGITGTSNIHYPDDDPQFISERDGSSSDKSE